MELTISIKKYSFFNDNKKRYHEIDYGNIGVLTAVNNSSYLIFGFLFIFLGDM